MKIATTGTGNIVALFIEAANANHDVECVSVFSRNALRAKAFANECGIAHSTDDWDELLASTDTDFIYIATPNSLHFQQAKQALQRGKNVICEKPFTSTRSELLELIGIAKSKNLFLFEAISTIHMPNFLKIFELLPDVGRIKLLNCSYSQFSSKYNSFLDQQNPNVFNPQFSGGALMDINIYNLHFIHRLFGTPIQVNYLANIADNGIDTSGIVTLRYADFVATCIGTKDSNGINYAQIQGEKGYLNVSQGANGCQSIYLNCNGVEKTINIQNQNNRLFYEIETFKHIYSQRDYKSCYALLEHSLQVMDTVEKARKSAGIYFPADS
ncbi:Gfo/Idh/MocA family protein [Scandinavium lactucae]|uniref:Gfo/Idh/MocA family oxidoreductase n=1 Tax=Scandinavium lactucae TaxID=3095028 RepID=A0ABU4QTU7_9ENTR|nr:MULTISPECIES: Gfo/Idh/MocA family oxidoreductase [unclassified Scandinavium]MDX6040695.1 Gfo/Idh/MocA family oxidoreductase [Scandinavium sp. V105_6]MDX6051599.1 Gfo/Idh/MocA family oxidoreductase [Scandinavium sp. V105_1]